MKKEILETIEKYKDDTTSTIARIIGKHCNRESINNVKKRREIRIMTSRQSEVLFLGE